MKPVETSSNTTLALMERYLDLVARRQNLVAENLAHLDTPGYRTRDIPFQEHMRMLVQEAEKGAESGASSTAFARRLPQAEGVADLPVRPDQNNVSLDREMGILSGNAARFSVVAQLLSQKLRLLRTSIKEGG